MEPCIIGSSVFDSIGSSAMHFIKSYDWLDVLEAVVEIISSYTLLVLLCSGSVGKRHIHTIINKVPFNSAAYRFHSDAFSLITISYASLFVLSVIVVS